MAAEKMDYEQAGVKYDTLDAFKRACQKAAATTTDALAEHGLSEPKDVRGESAYLIETEHGYLAHVEEGLGTKNIIADEMHRLTGRSFYANIGIDTVATMVNDLITCGALPWSIAMHAAVGDSAWFENTARADDLARGFAEGCRRSVAVWGGGETPALKGIVEKDAIVLAGSAVGRIAPKSNRIGGDVREGDAIVLLASSGVQTNGLTLCRAVAERLSEGYLTAIGDGRSYGESLLDASEIYVRFVMGCQKRGIRLHYAVHVTGHGWRKLMRLSDPFVYQIHSIGEPHAVFATIGTAAGLDAREMYATFNMGVGFAVMVDAADAAVCVEVAMAAGHRAWVGGTVLRDGHRKAVEIMPVDVSFEADSLQVR